MLRLFLNALSIAISKEMGVCENPIPKSRNIVIFKKLFFILIQLNFTIHNRLLRHLVLVIFVFFEENFSQTKCTLQAKGIK